MAIAALPVLAALSGPSSASAAPTPYWTLSTSTAPANLPPGGKGKLIVTATNLGDVATNGPITITDTLPPGLVLAAPPKASPTLSTFEELTCTPKTAPSSEPVRCTWNKPVLPSTGLKLSIPVKVEEASGTVTTLQNKVQASGGEAAPKSAEQPVKVSSATPEFGVEKYELTPEEEGGTPDAQAGSHPFQLTTTFALNQTAAEEPAALPRNLQFTLPPGMLGNPTTVPQCSQVDFATVLNGPANLCPPDTAIGVAEVTIEEPLNFANAPGTVTVPVFNLEPAPGEPARLGILALNVPVVLETSVRTGSDYAVVVTAKNTSQAAGVLSSKVTVWGVPGDPSHDVSRGWECAAGGQYGVAFQSCKSQQEKDKAKEEEEKAKGEEPKPFLTMPTSCGAGWPAPMQAQSWVPGSSYLPPFESEFQESLSGCSLLPFTPSITVEPDTQSGSTTAGMTVDVKIPQEEKPKGLAQAAVKSTTVALPEGLQLSPSAANGLLACSALQIGFLGSVEATQTNNNEFTPGPASCPDAAKVGTVSIKSPDLKNLLTGSVYLASQNTNPFQAPLVLYLVAQDPVSGVIVKLAGKVSPDPVTGQVVSTFENTPQVPFEELKLKFFGGPRASLSTPPLCGSYVTSASFSPWSGNAPSAQSSSFSITSGPGGGACSSNPQPFAPAFQAGSSNPQAGAFTPFTLTINRPDGHQALEGLSMHLPGGLAAMLSSVTPCPEPQAANNQCGPASLIGHSTASSGLGGEPFTLPGQVFLTGPYKGAPFGISVVTPAIAGPFNLGDVTVRSTINVDPSTAAVTINSDPFPTIIKGVPVQLKQINVAVDRPNFQFNPTNCNPMQISATMTGSQHTPANVSSPFRVTNCAALPFAPKLTATVGAQASKANGASFNVKVESKGFGQANIGKVELQLPESLPSRLTTIQKACADSVFSVNPAACNEGALIGKATIHTPVLKNPLTGPAYLVSHGNAAFPDVEFVLQGEGITLVLDGKTDIKKGITYSRFESAPDAPFTTFDTELPAGPHSALAVYVSASKNYNLCGANLAMPTVITAQDGAVIKQTTNIEALPCGGVKPFKETRLEKALKECRKKYKKNKHKRAVCEKQARKKYGPKHKKITHGKKKKK